MAWSEITLEMTFDAGHRIVGHKGKCARLHGHTYRVQITVSGEVKEPGFVVDFGDLKELVNVWDHRMLLWEQDPLALQFGAPPDVDDLTIEQWWRNSETEEGIIRLQFNPTAENMAANLAYRIHTEFPNVKKVTVKLWETPNAMARASR